MFRRYRSRKWLVAGLGLAALVLPTTALAGDHNMSSQAYRALVAKGQAMNQRYAVFAQGQALDERYGNLKYGPPDGWYGYAVSLTQQSKQPIVTDGRSPDTVDAAIAYQTGLSPVDGRSPDTVDFAVQAHNPFTVSSGSQGFQWGDFGVGGGVALGAVIILLLSLLALRSAREEQTPITGT